MPFIDCLSNGFELPIQTFLYGYFSYKNFKFLIKPMSQTLVVITLCVITCVSLWYVICPFWASYLHGFTLELTPKGLILLGGDLFTCEPLHLSISNRCGKGIDDCHNYPFFWDPTSSLATLPVGYRL